MKTKILDSDTRIRKFKITFQKEDFSFDSVIIEANNKREAVDKFKPITTSKQRRYIMNMTKEVK